MKRYICILLLIAIILANPLTVLAFEEANTLPSGIKSSEIESVIDSYVKRNESTTAAVSVAVFSGKKVLLEKAYGNIDLENGIANDDSAVFEWGSNTKLLVWTSVMQLAEQGKIDLKEDIRTYLPKGFLAKLKYDTPITMINLMNHTAGWQGFVTDLFIENKSDVRNLGDALKFIEPEQVYKPGTVVSYSNWGAALAGYIVECVSGQSFDDYVHEHIFKPLGMEHTGLNADLSDNAWVMERIKKVKFYSTGKEPLGISRYYLSLYPAGGATGTLGDFVKFAQAFVPAQGEKSPLFQKGETLDGMLSPSLYFADGETGRNSHGFWTDKFAVDVLWHNGGTNGSTSWFAFDPKSGIGVVILTNQGHEYIYTCGILPMIFGKMQYTSDTKTSQDISGMYLSAQTCLTGYAKLKSMLDHIQLVRDEKGGYTVPGRGFTFTGIGTNSYVVDRGGIKQDLVFAGKLEDGTPVLQLPGTDYIKVNGYGVIAKYLLLFLFVISALISAVTLPINVVSAVRHNKRRPFAAFRIAVNAAVITAAAMFSYISVTLYGYSALFRMVQWSLILNTLCAVVPIAFLIVLIMKWGKTEWTKKQRIGLILSVVGGLIMTANIIFWNAYKFW